MFFKQNTRKLIIYLRKLSVNNNFLFSSFLGTFFWAPVTFERYHFQSEYNPGILYLYQVLVRWIFYRLYFPSHSTKKNLRSKMFLNSLCNASKNVMKASKYYTSILPESIRKLLIFWRFRTFSEVMEREHRDFFIIFFEALQIEKKISWIQLFSESGRMT